MAEGQTEERAALREAHARVRRRSVLDLARRCDWEQGHSQHVTGLALSIFDQLRSLHGLDAPDRELLQHAGLLHDIGYCISAKGHHKHSHYLIANSELEGFLPWEVQVIAAVARYHRRRGPRADDKELAGLDAHQRHLVEVLAGILRVADGLDRTHFSLVQQVQIDVADGAVQLCLTAVGDVELEVRHSSGKADLLEEVLRRPLRIRTVGGSRSGEAGRNVLP